jgi:hypothetical protein
LPGDLLIRGPMYNKPHGHIKFFESYDGPGDTADQLARRGLNILDAAGPSSNPQVGERRWSGPTNAENYYLLRPMPFGAESSLSASNVYKDSLKGMYGKTIIPGLSVPQ